MTKTIMLTSTKAGAGKTIVAIGMYLKLDEMGANPGYFKPIGEEMALTKKTRTDKDVSVISSIVSKKFSKDDICPVYLNPESYLDTVQPEEANQMFEQITDNFKKVSSKSDVVLVEGNHFGSQYSPLGLDDVRFAREFNASIIICAPIADDDDLNYVIAKYEYMSTLGLDLMGVILNARSKTAEVRIERYHIPLLEKRNIKVIGALKNSRALEKPTISEIIDATGAKLYSGEYINIKNNLIDSFVVGAMRAENALKIFRKSVDKCVITGGDQADIALAALETSTKLILFTCNFDPIQRVVSVAEEKGVPLLTTSADTYTVTEQLRKIRTHIQLEEIQLCREQVDNLNWDQISL